MNAHADMLIVVRTQRIKHTKGHLSLSCFGYVKFSGFRSSKTSANKRLLLCLLPSAADVQTSPAQVHGAKVLQNLRMCKKNRILVRFFWCRVSGVKARIISSSSEEILGIVRLLSAYCPLIVRLLSVNSP